jgi:biotin transport system substrate-specific component
MQTAPTLTGTLVPGRNVLREVLIILGGTLFLAASSRVSLCLPFTPVPVSAQTLAVLLTGMVLGSVRGAACTTAYLAQGAAGLPVFAGGAGPLYLLGPTGGYLAGFVAAAFATGLLAERGWDRRASTTALSMILGNALIYLFGLAWLSRFVGTADVLRAGFYPFLAGDLLKVALATALMPVVWKVAGRA